MVFQQIISILRIFWIQKILGERLGYWQTYFAERDITMKTAMFADINGISMGCRNELIRHGVEFLYTNIHCHHGMYPLRQNQTLTGGKMQTDKDF